MAVNLEAGKIYKASLVRSGVSQRGDWEMVKVVEGRKEITIWPDNKPTGVTEGGEFEIETISSVKYGARKRQNGTWQDDVSITATIKPASTNSYDFDADSFDDGELPWKMDDNPYNLSEDEQLPL